MKKRDTRQRLNGDALRKARGEQSPETVAIATGLTPGTIANAEAGRRVNAKTRAKLAEYYGLTEDEISLAGETTAA